jgi:hypothetical protein
MDSPSKRTLAEGDESNSYGGIMDLKSKSEAKGEEEEDMEMV